MKCPKDPGDDRCENRHLREQRDIQKKVGYSLRTAAERFELVHAMRNDHHRDRRGKLRSVRALRGIDYRVGVKKALWGLAERVVNGESLPPVDSLSFTA